MKEQFINKNFKPQTLSMITVCNRILDSYAEQGYDLSLRQLYYQLVSRDMIPNSQKSYSRLGNIVNDARLAGLLDWDMIVDRGRSTIFNSHWENPADIVRSAANSFRIDKWEDQPVHIEVMVEKQALEGVLAPVCKKLDVNFTSNKGYSSQSFMYRKGQELQERIHAGKEIVVLYLGDHDPSGLDMDRDVQERLTMFARQLNFGFVNLRRLALLKEQIEELQPPPNPAKVTDSRAESYIREHGRVSWELDAVEPRMLARIVTEAIESYRDDDLWDAAVERENEGRDELREWADNYEEV